MTSSRWILTVEVDGVSTRMTTNAGSRAEAAANVLAYFDAEGEEVDDLANVEGVVKIVSVERDRSFRRPGSR